MNVAIVILNWNGKDMLRRFLPSVINSSIIDGVRVVVADNGSEDGSVTMLKNEFTDIDVVTLDKNYGFAQGYNIALKQIEADIYVLLNSDVLIKDREWISPILKYMAENLDVAACQPKILSLNNPTSFEYAGAAGGFLDKYAYPFCRGRIFDSIEDDKGQYDNVLDIMWASGAALVVRRDDFWNAGAFDETFFAHMEEIDLCWRIRALGKRIVYVPKSRVFHLGGASLNQGNPRKIYLNFRNNLIMIYNNLDESSARRVLRIRKWLDFMAALVFLLKGDRAAYKAVMKARRDFISLLPDLTNKKLKFNHVHDKVTNPDRCGFSIVWQYYFRWRKTFDKLPFC